MCRCTSIFTEISRGNGQFDMSRLFEGTLVGARPDLAVNLCGQPPPSPANRWKAGWMAGSRPRPTA